jgi:hypothetical protein
MNFMKNRSVTLSCKSRVNKFSNTLSALHKSFIQGVSWFSVITNVYNKNAKWPTLMELFTATGKLEKNFWQPETFDVCTTGDTAHNTVFNFLPHTRQHGCIDILHCCNDPCLSVKNIEASILKELEYHIDVCLVTRGAHIERLWLSKNFFSIPVAVNNSIKVGPLVILL